MKRITIKGKRIRTYCECDKGHRWTTEGYALSPKGLKGHCMGVGMQCPRCYYNVWTYSEVK